MSKARILLVVLAAILLSPSAFAQTRCVNKAITQDIPLIWYEPRVEVEKRSLVIWQDGFTGNKEKTNDLLVELAEMGFVALSYDNFEHGERAIPGDNLWRRIFANDAFRSEMWPIIGQSVADAKTVIDWAVKELNINGEICMGGFSMGGDISVAAAGNDSRIKCVAAIVSTPEWTRPDMYKLDKPTQMVQQGEADEEAQAFYDLYNPNTHIENYTHQPAITFESGALDTHIPSSDAKVFQEKLVAEYPDFKIRVIDHDAGHELSDSMWENSKAWFREHLQ